jgi:hypothetical protein
MMLLRSRVARALVPADFNLRECALRSLPMDLKN